MFKLLRTDSQNPDFISLVQLLDVELAQRDGDEYSFYAQFNQLAAIKHVMVAYDADRKPAACGALKEYAPDIMEVKRMFTLSTNRGKGLASNVLQALETWAIEMGYQTCILETGPKQPEAIRLYEKNGYEHIHNYGQYVGVVNSICFEKRLAPAMRGAI